MKKEHKDTARTITSNPPILPRAGEGQQGMGWRGMGMKRDQGYFYWRTDVTAETEGCPAPLRQAESVRLHWLLALFTPCKCLTGWAWICLRCTSYSEAMYILTSEPYKDCKLYWVGQTSWEPVCIQPWKSEGLSLCERLCFAWKSWKGQGLRTARSSLWQMLSKAPFRGSCSSAESLSVSSLSLLQQRMVRASMKHFLLS